MFKIPVLMSYDQGISNTLLQLVTKFCFKVVVPPFGAAASDDDCECEAAFRMFNHSERVRDGGDHKKGSALRMRTRLASPDDREFPY